MVVHPLRSWFASENQPTNYCPHCRRRANEAPLQTVVKRLKQDIRLELNYLPVLAIITNYFASSLREPINISRIKP